MADGIQPINWTVRLITGVISLVLLVVGVIFALTNRQAVEIHLWPLGQTHELPLFLIVLGTLFAGFVIGGAASWFSGGRQRRQARVDRMRARSMENEIARLKRSQPQPTTGGLPTTAAGR